MSEFKHAYLILAHNQFEVTKHLISSLDDFRNDIYIHYDKKIASLPRFQTKYSNVYFIDKRIDVRWGDSSVVEAEYNLFESAVNKNYRYYHLVSGVDMPLRTQDYIHDFFNDHNGKEFIGYSQYNYDKEVERKMNKFHFFSRDFRSSNEILSSFKAIVRSLFLKVQDVMGFKRNSSITFKKGTQWVSVTHEFVQYLIRNRERVLDYCQYTFCSDEIYKQTLCWNSDFRYNIYNTNDEGLGCMRKIGWVGNEIIDWTANDFDDLVSGPHLFARKFNEQNIDVVNKLSILINSSNKFNINE